MTKKYGIWVISLAMLLLLLSVTVVTAQSTVTEFEATESLSPIGVPAREWVSEDGILHLRGFPVAGPVWGDLNGTLTVVADINLELASGSGTAHGTANLEVDWNGKSGTFEGRSQWKYSYGSVVDGQFIGHGTGDFAGMHMQANFYDIGGGNTALEGIIHDPQGS